MRPLPLSLVSALMVFLGCLVWAESARAEEDGDDRQVADIRRNTLSDRKVITSGEDSVGESALTEAKGTASMPGAFRLVGVPDISVETIVGHLPRLPHTIRGVYSDDPNGRDVRVIWPSPDDNRQALEPGRYTVTGRLPGTNFQPKAIVTVKPAPDIRSAPRRKLEPFSLGQVVLNQNEKQQDTLLIKNRDKFILALAKTDPDRFLYMFRDAFGQEQPEGARPLGGWDSQTTKLRGHASGHYLSAIAQAMGEHSPSEGA